MMSRLFTYIAMTAAVVLIAAGAGSEIYVARNVKAPVPAPMASSWEQTPSNMGLNPTGGVFEAIISLQLPAGKWIIHADETIVDRGAVDFVGCGIFDGSVFAQSDQLNVHRTLVANAASASGNDLTVGAISPMSETAAINLSSPTPIVLACEHDSTHTSNAPYVDAGADMVAQQAGRLSIITPQG